MTSLSRRIFTWKFYFYDLLLPSLRYLSPARSDAVVCTLGKASTFLRPGRRAKLKAAIRRVNTELKRDEAAPSDWTALAESSARFTARDYALDVRDDAEALGRFDVTGYDEVEKAMAQGRGVILVGSHFGAHIAGLHWLFRSGLPVRALIQRPKHVSADLSRRFDAAVSPYPQAEFFLRRDLSPTAGVGRTLQARSALRDGLAMYLNGDIVWEGANTRTCRLLGRDHPFLTIWTDLAALTRSPVFFVFCKHLPGGRFTLEFKRLDATSHKDADPALAEYLNQVEAHVAADPAEAVAYLTWPCYTTSTSLPPKPPRAQRAGSGPFRRFTAFQQRIRKNRRVSS